MSSEHDRDGLINEELWDDSVKTRYGGDTA